MAVCLSGRQANWMLSQHQSSLGEGVRLEGKTAKTERPPVTPVAVKIGTACNCTVLTIVNLCNRSAGQVWYKEASRQGARSLDIMGTST